jgi:hypothetical protein
MGFRAHANRLVYIALIALVVGGLAVAGYHRYASAGIAPDSHVALTQGAHCTVQFRRDALGAGASTPFSPTWEGYNGAELCLKGDLATIDADWVAIDLKDRSRCWIAKSSILTITTASAGNR